MFKLTVFSLCWFYVSVILLCLQSCSSPYNPTAPIIKDEVINKTIYNAKLKTRTAWYRDTVSIEGKNFGKYIPAVSINLGNQYIKPITTNDTVIKFIVPRGIERKVYNLILYVRDDTVYVEGDFQLGKPHWNNFIKATVIAELMCKEITIVGRDTSLTKKEESVEFTTTVSPCTQYLFANRPNSRGTIIADSCFFFLNESSDMLSYSSNHTFSATIDTINKEILNLRIGWKSDNHAKSANFTFGDCQYFDIRKIPYVDNSTTIEGVIQGKQISDVLNKVVYYRYDKKKFPITTYHFVGQSSMFKDSDYVKIVIEKEQ